MALKLTRSIPGKVFILGEYAVLWDAPAVVATVGPRFQVAASGNGEWGTTFHPESPAGLLAASFIHQGRELPALRWIDPHQAVGGLGGSTAQFALLFAEVFSRSKGQVSSVEVRRQYREILKQSSAGEPLPSGVDLVAQWEGGVVYFDPASEQVLSIWDNWDWSNLLIFSAAHQAGRKVLTHDHLAGLGALVATKARPQWVDALALELSRWLQGEQSRGLAMQNSAEILASQNLELRAAYEDRIALSKLAGVTGVKGSGALLADTVLVELNADRADRAEIIARASERGLRLIADGISYEEGIQ